MKIPKHAKSVFSGILFEVFQWEQKLFDGSKTTFEMVARPGCTDIIATVGNKVILLKQEQPGRNPYYSLPSGRIDAGETALHGAKRELLEETGFSSKNWQKFKSWNSASKIDFQETTFIARNCEMTELPNTDAGEKIAMQLVSFDDFLDAIRDPNFIICPDFKYFLYECLIDKKLKSEFKKFIFGK